MIRIVVAGARCSHQGIGEFVARGLHNSGAEIAGIVGTSERTVEEARNTLQERYDIRTNGYTSLSTALEKEQPQAVALCTPNAVHRQQLAAAAEAGVHCLCEKPLWWTREAVNVHQVTKDITDAFVKKGLLLDLVTQWPFTLDAFDTLHPGVRREPIEMFEMILSPSSSGEAMIPAALPHVLSLLYAMVGRGDVYDVSTRYDGSSGENLSIDFRYRYTGRDTQVACRFSTMPQKPRPAAYAINGRWVHRTIRLPDYEIAIEAEGRSVRIEDPLDLLVRDFLDRLKSRASTNCEKLLTSMVALEAVAAIAARP